MPLSQKLMMLGQETISEAISEFLSCVHQYIAQAHLKTLLEMIHSSNQLFYGLWLMAFIYLALFCVVEKVTVL